MQITKVQKGTYYAEMHIQRGETVLQVDARPSDSIAVAIRFPAPIFADEALFVGASDEDGSEGESVIPETEPRQSTDEMTAEQLKRYLSNLRPEDFGKFNL